MHPSLIIAGDVHHASGEGGFTVFLDQLLARPPAHLVLLGDLVEYWLESEQAAQRHAPVLDRLRRLSRLGWELDVVAGNREAMAGRRLELAAGCRLHWPHLDLTVGGLRIRVVHGDRLCHDPGYRALASLLRSFVFRVWQGVHPIAVRELVARWMRSNSRSHRLARETDRRRQPFLDPRRVAGASRRADLLVAGHIHRTLRRRLRGVELILVGDWPGRRGSWVEIFSDGRVEHRLVDLL